MDKKNIINFPYYLVLTAIYPALSLFASNFRQVDPKHIIRPLIFSVLLSVLIYYLIYHWMKDKIKAGVFTTIFVFVFFNYGRAFIYLKDHADWSKSFGDQNYLFITLGAIVVLWISKKIIDNTNKIDIATIYIVCLTLIFLPAYNIGKLVTEEQKSYIPTDLDFPETASSEPMPDIYHIVLDEYSRVDYLAQLGYDNSEFMKFLREQNFFVADCSRSNYQRTALSLTSTLNLDYLWEVFPDKRPPDRDDAAIYAALSNNRAQHNLRKLGYQFITTVNGYPWSEHSSYADIIVAPEVKDIFAPYILPFEKKFLENSFLSLLIDLGGLKTFQKGYLLNGQQYEQVVEALDYLSTIPTISGPTYTYYHLIVPHSPYIFSKDGTFASPIPEPEGYIRSIEFINNALKPIILSIIRDSETPPVIIIQGDHGFITDDSFRFQIFYAIHIPGGNETLYPTISPVNTYRVVFNQLFDLNLPLLPDESIRADIGRPFRTKPANLVEEAYLCP
jgi:hypothetical protein